MSRMAWLRLERWFSLVEAVVRFRVAGMKARSKSEKEAIGVTVRPGIRMLRSLSSLMGRYRVPGDSRSRTWGGTDTRWFSTHPASGPT